MPTAITLDTLVKHYPSMPTPAVDAVSLAIQPGELFFLLGPSGCGKTTLLRMIAGFIEPDSGRVLLDKGDARPVDVTRLEPSARNTAMVFQSYALWPHMSVFQNVAFGLEVRKMGKDEIARRVAAALASVQMEHLAQRKPGALSGGQQQRVALARALVVRPDVLLLDEPLSNLDAKLRAELREQIRSLCKEAGITTLYVTHDQHEALSMADRAAILHAGRLVQVGTPMALYRQPQSRFVAEFLGETHFLPARVVETRPGMTRLGTAAGELVSAHAPPTDAREVLVSLRPEALRVGPGDNPLRGSILQSTYLGATRQLLVELPGQQRVKVAILNPGSADEPPAGQTVSLSVSPQDVVMVPATGA